MSKVVIILGMHRSGTSLIAGILHHLGVDMGRHLLGRSWSNPLGHFENIEFLDLNERILKEAGGSWREPPRKEKILELNGKFSEEIRNVIKKNKNNVWGWKDPRTVLTIDLFINFLENPYFIVCNRNVMDIAKSLYKRDKIPIEEGLNLIKIYINRINEFFRNNKEYNKRRLDVYYEDIINNPLGNIKRIVEFLDLKPSKEQVIKALSFIKPRDMIERLEKNMLIEERRRKKRELIALIKDPQHYPIYVYKVLKNPKIFRKYIDILITFFNH